MPEIPGTTITYTDYDGSGNPRLINLPDVADVAVQDLVDTLSALDAELDALIYDHVLESSGKEDLGGGTLVGITVELQNAQLKWAAQPSPTVIKVQGGNTLAVDDVGAAIDPAAFSANVNWIVAQSSSATLQEQEAIEFASFNGAVTVDVLSAFSGTTFPVGTLQAPVNNVADALAIAAERGLPTLRFISNATITAGDFTSKEITGVGGRNNIKLTFSAGATVLDAKFRDITVAGVLAQNCSLVGCVIDTLSIDSGFLDFCILRDVVTPTGTGPLYIFECKDGDPGAGTPVIDLATFTGELGVRNFAGGLALVNKVTADTAAVDFAQGRLVVDASCTAGTIRYRNAKVSGTTGGTVLSDASYLTETDIWAGSFSALSRITGTVHENAYLDQQVWVTINGRQLLQSARERVYDTEANAIAHGATGLLEEYSVVCTYDANGDQLSFQRTRVGS